MFYFTNPNYRYKFFSQREYVSPEDPEPVAPPKVPTKEPSKRNLVGALAALYRAYGGEEELKNNAVDIIYKIADVINERNNPAEEVVHGPEKKD